MRTSTKFAGGIVPRVEVSDDAASPITVPPAEIPSEPDELLEEVLRLAREPLVLDDEVPPEVVEAVAAAGLPPGEYTLSEEALSAAFNAITSTHASATQAIREMVASAGEQRNGGRADWLTAAALATLDKFAQRPQPNAPDIHVHTPKQDLHVTVEQPEFKPQITVEGAEITVPEREVKVDVHVPEQPAPQVTVAAATPEVTVQAAPAPVVNVNMPDSIRTIPAEVETVAERDADDLIVRSVTRPTGE